MRSYPLDWLYSSRDAFITLYDSIILPNRLFDYYSAVSDGRRKINLDYLDKLQRGAVAIIKGRNLQ